LQIIFFEIKDTNLLIIKWLASLQSFKPMTPVAAYFIKINFRVATKLPA